MLDWYTMNRLWPRTVLSQLVPRNGRAEFLFLLKGFYSIYLVFLYNGILQLREEQTDF